MIIISLQFHLNTDSVVNNQDRRPVTIIFLKTGLPYFINVLRKRVVSLSNIDKLLYYIR